MRRKYFHNLHHLPLTQIELKFKVKVEEEEEVASRKGRYTPPVLSRDISLQLILQPGRFQIIIYSFDTFKTRYFINLYPLEF